MFLTSCAYATEKESLLADYGEVVLPEGRSKNKYNPISCFTNSQTTDNGETIPSYQLKLDFSDASPS